MELFWFSLSFFFGVFQFFASDDRIKAVRRMIMAATTEQRKAALNLLLPYQRSDFEGIFRAMDGIFQNALESQYIGLLSSKSICLRFCLSFAINL